MSGYWIVLPVRGSVYVAAFAYCIGRIIIVANAATNKKVNVTFLFILPTIITAKDGFRYIFYVLIEVEFIQGKEKCVSKFENIKRIHTDGRLDISMCLISAPASVRSLIA